MKADHRRDRKDLGLSRVPLGLLNVDVGEHDIGTLKGDLLDLGLQLLAGHTPGGTKLDDHMSVSINELSDVIFVTSKHVSCSKMAAKVGYDPTTYRLTADYSTTELLGQLILRYILSFNLVQTSSCDP